MSRDAFAAKLEDAIVARLAAVGFASAVDLRAAPPDEEGWKSNARISCRVIWVRNSYSDEGAVGGQLQERRTGIMLAWRFKKLAGGTTAYDFLDLAGAALNGWVPRPPSDVPSKKAPKLAARLRITSERLVDVDQLGWRYEQLFAAPGFIGASEDDDLIAAAVTRITSLNAQGDDLSPPVDVFDEGGGA